MEIALVKLGEWLKLIAPITGGLTLLWKYFLKKKYDEFKVAHKNLEQIVTFIPIIQKIEAELKPNGGSSIRDAINRIESKLTATDQKMMALLKTMPYGMWLSDSNGRCIDMNLALCNITGRSESELIGENWSKWVKEKTLVYEEWSRCIENEIDFEMEYTFIKPDKTEIRVKGTALQIRGIKGELLGFVGRLVELK
jgi:PAS domain S-box-containing protein